MPKISKTDTSAPKRVSKKSKTNSKPNSQKMDTNSLEAQALAQMEAALPKIKVYIEKLAETIKTDKFDAENALYKQAKNVDSENHLIPNEPIERLLNEYADLGYEVLELLREFKQQLVLSEVKISTSNDMTTQARAALSDETAACMVKAAEFGEILYNYYAKYRIEIGRRFDKFPAIQADCLNCIAMGERQTVQDMRYKVKSFKYQLESMIQVWENNREFICKKKSDDDGRY